MTEIGTIFNVPTSARVSRTIVIHDDPWSSKCSLDNEPTLCDSPPADGSAGSEQFIKAMEGAAEVLQLYQEEVESHQFNLFRLCHHAVG